MNNNHNIFNLPNPASLHCMVWKYSASFSSMAIQIHQGGENVLYELGFSGIGYFSGVLSWQSADFRLADNQELKAFADSIGLTEDVMKNSNVSLKHKLYIVDGFRRNVNIPIQIFAYSHTINKVV